MAYIDTSEVKQIREALKKNFPNLRFSVVREHYSSVKVRIMKGDVDFSDLDGYEDNGHVTLNPYRIDIDDSYDGHTALFRKIVDTIKNGSDHKWYNNSDAMIDYFDTAFYIHFSIGRWDRPYQLLS
jgi:hypothetical protein